MQSPSTMSCLPLLLLVSFSLLAKGRNIPGDTKSGDPDTFLNTSPDTFLNTSPDTFLNTYPDTFPDTYLDTFLETPSESSLNRT